MPNISFISWIRLCPSKNWTEKKHLQKCHTPFCVFAAILHIRSKLQAFSQFWECREGKLQTKLLFAGMSIAFWYKYLPGSGYQGIITTATHDSPGFTIYYHYYGLAGRMKVNTHTTQMNKKPPQSVEARSQTPCCRNAGLMCQTQIPKKCAHNFTCSSIYLACSGSLMFAYCG